MKKSTLPLYLLLLIVFAVFAIGIGAIWLPFMSPLPSKAYMPFVGWWFGHSRTLIITPDGHAHYTGRVFRWCSTNPSPCDNNNGEILSGLSENLQLTRVDGATAFGTIVSGTDDYGPDFTSHGYNPTGKLLLKVGSEISLTLKPNNQLSLSDGWILCKDKQPTPVGDPEPMSPSETVCNGA